VPLGQERAHGAADPDDVLRTYEYYSDPDRGGVWRYATAAYAGNIWRIDYQWDEGVEVSLDEARATAATLMPTDAQYQFTGADRNGFTMDVYFSPSLVDRFPPGGVDPWSGDQPGSLLVIYSADDLSGGCRLGFHHRHRRHRLGPRPRVRLSSFLRGAGEPRVGGRRGPGDRIATATP
jgi:hypothetical protein